MQIVPKEENKLQTTNDNPTGNDEGNNYLKAEKNTYTTDFSVFFLEVCGMPSLILKPKKC